MYKLIGSQKLGKGQKSLDSSSNQTGPFKDKSGGKSSGGSNLSAEKAYNGKAKAGPVGGVKPYDEVYAKKGGSMSRNEIPGASNEFTASKNM